MNKCKQCGIETSNYKFCSRSCSTSYNNSSRPKRKRKHESCLNCGKSLIGKHPDNIFCDLECFREHSFKEKVNDFLKGRSLHPKTQRKCLKYLRGDTCSECGLTSEWNGNPLTLHVDHVDGNSDNNNPENLRLLCPNCHSQTETYCGTLGVKKFTKRNKYLRRWKGY